MGWMIRLGLMMLFLLAVLGATLWIYFNTGLPETDVRAPSERVQLLPAMRTATA
jgi:hypothetical protein